MRQKLSGLLFLLIGAGSGVYGIILLGPVIWAWITATAEAIAQTVAANANAFAVFQAANPATVGIIAIFAGAVFAGVGFMMTRSEPPLRQGGRFGSSRRASEPELDPADRVGGHV